MTLEYLEAEPGDAHSSVRYTNCFSNLNKTTLWTVRTGG